MQRITSTPSLHDIYRVAAAAAKTTRTDRRVTSIHLLNAIFASDDPDVVEAIRRAGTGTTAITDLVHASENTEAMKLPGDDYTAAKSLGIAIATSRDGSMRLTPLAMMRALLACSVAGHLIDEEAREKLYEAADDVALGVAPKPITEIDNDSPDTAYARNLTRQAKQGRLDPVVGRDDEIERVLRVLSRRTKANPILIGEPGVGKTAIVEGVAQRIAAGECDEDLAGRQLIVLDIPGMVAGAKLRGMFEERLRDTLEEGKARGDIFFIDETHMVVGAGDSDGATDAANILKPYLARGDIKCIGGTTIAEWRQKLSRDAAIERRFQPVPVDAPDVEKTIVILREAHRPLLEAHHKITIPDAVLREAAEVADRFLHDRNMPDKAIDLLDEASVLARGGEMTVAQIHQVASEWTGIPESRFSADDGELLLQMEQQVRDTVFGQESALAEIMSAMAVARSGLGDPDRPQASLFFHGPRGVGKTMTAETIAEYYFGTKDALITISGSDYTDDHAVARLFGSPPGFKNNEEGGQLTEKVHARPYSVVFVDEADKMAPAVLDALMQIPDSGQETDGQGRTVDFTHVVFIVAGNFGRHQPGNSMGFGQQSEEQRIDQARKDAKKEVEQALRPEFLDRFDAEITFEFLDKESLHAIATREIATVVDRAAKRGVKVTYDDRLIDVLTDGAGALASGREVRRAVRKNVSAKLGLAMAKGGAGKRGALHVSVGADGEITAAAPVRRQRHRDLVAIGA